MATAEKHPILVVDDEAEILTSLRALLRKDYEFHAAQSGYEGLQVLKRQPIHVVMADQRMPGMTGTEFLAAVRAEHPAIVRLVFTGHADIRAVIEAINQGHVFRYLAKPWDADELLLVLRQACEHYERGAERDRLLEDVGAGLRHCQALLDGLRGQPAWSAAAEELAREVPALLQRLGRARC
jgi:DNA-binding NtrC family response regulator